MNDQMCPQTSRYLSDLCRVVWRADEQTLVQLLQADASILANIPSGCQTPLHISALLGNVPFTEALLHRNLAITGDSSGRTALHLACAEGNLRIVQILLHFNNELCLVRDGEKRIPLHYAAIRGRTEVVQELIMASPDSLSLVDGEDSTVFHLCVTHNHLDTLQTLVKLDYATANITAGQPRPPIFTRPDRARNTILHLAIMLKRVEVVSYLRSIPEIMGFTADDILMKRSPKDLEICEIQHMLTPEEFEITGVVRVHDDDDPCIKMCKHAINYCVIVFMDWLKQNDDKWLGEMRGHLSVVSTFIATITFQGLINPPGGFIQQGLPPSSQGNTPSSSSNNVTSSDDLGCTTILLPDNRTYCPGQALASSSRLRIDLESYLFYVTISFFSSICVTLLLVSGILPMKNKAMIWMLSMGMCIALTSLAGAYVTAINVITPSHLWQDKLLSHVKTALYLVWIRKLLGLIVLLISLRFYCVGVMIILKKLKSSWRKHPCSAFLFSIFGIILALLGALSIQSVVLFVVSLILGHSTSHP